MPDIKTWLADLGLEKYQDVFVAAEVDYATLPELREADLLELGLPLGPRRKVAAALARLASDGPAARTAPAASSSAVSPERRHLTVMFVDLVGSTEMVMRMDAEDMRSIITAYQKAVARVVDDFDGFVATLLGDGMLCYFGWPHANEDDTDRAVRAGLAVIETTKSIMTPDGVPLASRVGVASGVVVVGDLTGGAARQEAAAIGETPNLAARLQCVADPNQLVVPAEVLPLLGTKFELDHLGPQTLKGVSRTVDAYVVEREIYAESRFGARGDGAIIPIVGRNHEIDTVVDRWANAVSGYGRMVLLRGQAGIGKSRIVKSIIDVATLNNHRRVILQCSPYHVDGAFYPFIQHITHAAGITPGDTVEERLDKIEEFIGHDQKLTALIARLLELDGSLRYPPLTDTPADLRAMTMQVLIDMFLADTAQNPLLIVVEDLHWIDPTSLQLLDMMAAAVINRKVMILATSRPTVAYKFATPEIITTLDLNRLGEDEVYEMVTKLTRGRALPPVIMNVIVRRTDGIPLFVEEMTRTILESDALVKESGRYVIKGVLGDIAIPATLHDSLMARLDRLGDTKEIAQIAACIGRTFSYDLVAQICELPVDALAVALEKLIAADLIQCDSVEPQLTYVFKHALVRDAAYDSLIKDVRRTYHTRILDATEADIDITPEFLAAHAEAANLTDRAVDLWAAAGRAAMTRPAYQEAETHLRRAIQLNAQEVAADDYDAIQRAIALNMQLFVALAPEKGLWSNASLATLEEAMTLANRVDETPLQADIIYGLLMSNYFRGNLATSLDRADDLTAMAEASSDVAQLLVARRLAGIVRLKMGRFAEAQPYLDQAEALAEEADDGNLAARFGHDPIVGVHIYQAFNLIFQAKTKRAWQYRISAEKRAEMIDHTNTSCAMHSLFVVCSQAVNDHESERRHMGILQELVDTHDVTASRMWAEASAALLQLDDGDPKGLAVFYDADARMIDADVKLLVPGNRVVAARRALKIGLLDEARKLMHSAGRMMHETGEKSWLPDIYRLRATMARNEGNVDIAEKNLKRAIEIAQDTGGVLWELRASIDLAELYSESDRQGQVISTIRPVFDKIGEGDCRREMAIAKDLMLGFIAAK